MLVYDVERELKELKDYSLNPYSIGCWSMTLFLEDAEEKLEVLILILLDVGL